MDRTLLIYWSKTGNTKTFVDYFVNNSTNEVDIINVSKENIDASILDNYNKICIGCYTWNNGKIPPKAKRFIINNSQHFKNKDIFIFGSGNTTYTYFCAAVDNIEIIMNDLQSNVEYKVKFDNQFHESDFTEDHQTELKKAIQKF